MSSTETSSPCLQRRQRGHKILVVFPAMSGARWFRRPARDATAEDAEAPA